MRALAQLEGQTSFVVDASRYLGWVAAWIVDQRVAPAPWEVKAYVLASGHVAVTGAVTVHPTTLDALEFQLDGVPAAIRGAVWTTIQRGVHLLRGIPDRNACEDDDPDVG